MPRENSRAQPKNIANLKKDFPKARRATYSLARYLAGAAASLSIAKSDDKHRYISFYRFTYSA